MKLLKITIAFIALVSLQIAAAQWLHVPPPVEAKNLMIFTAGVPVTGYTLQQEQTVENDSMDWANSTTVNERAAGSFIASSGYTLTKIGVQIDKIGLPTSTITAQIWNDSSTYPGSSLGTSTNTHTGSEVDGATYLEFTFSPGIALTNAVQYWIVLYIGDNLGNASAYYGLPLSNSAGANKICRNEYSASWSGTDWSSNIIGMCFKSYSGG